MKKTTGLLADDPTIGREGFHKVLEFEDDFKIIGEAENGHAVGKAGSDGENT